MYNIANHYRNQPFSYFFVALLGLILLSPVLEDHLYGERLIRVLFTITLAAAVCAASEQRKALILSICLAVPWLILTWSGVGTYETSLDLIARFLFVALNMVVFCLIIHRVISADVIDVNIICGGLALYLLLAVNWAVTYVIIEGLAPGSFAAGDAPIAWHKFLYFSLTTITTLGYGDFLPTSPFARIWATLEAVTGVLYIAVLIARLVSLYRK
jgi:hypothetical protein